jgi:hypothetical protein
MRRSYRFGRVASEPERHLRPTLGRARRCALLGRHTSHTQPGPTTLRRLICLDRWHSRSSSFLLNAHCGEFFFRGGTLLTACAVMLVSRANRWPNASKVRVKGNSACFMPRGRVPARVSAENAFGWSRANLGDRPTDTDTRQVRRSLAESAGERGGVSARRDVRHERRAECRAGRGRASLRRLPRSAIYASAQSDVRRTPTRSRCAHSPNAGDAHMRPAVWWSGCAAVLGAPHCIGAQRCR